VTLIGVQIKHLLLPALPGVAILTAAGLSLGLAQGSPILAEAAHTYAYIALAAALLLSWRLHCGRLIVAALALTITSVAMQPAWLGGNALAQALVATFIPAGIAVLSLCDDGFAGVHLRKYVAVTFAPVLIAAFLSAGRMQRALQLLSTNVIDPAYTAWTQVTQLALLGTGVALLAAMARVIRTERAGDVGLAWLIVTLGLALASPAGSVARGIWVLAGALVLLVALVETAYAMAFHDELTGLPSRRALRRVQSALQAPFALAIVDVDHFKSFNDRYGHDVGDQVLRMVASRLRAVGGGGQAFRSGGEEFTIVFEGLNKQEALPHLEAVREAVENSAFALRKLPRPKGKRANAGRGRGAAGQQLQVTISVGVAAASAKPANVGAVLKAADKAMYQAKNAGRNQVFAPH